MKRVWVYARQLGNSWVTERQSYWLEKHFVNSEDELVGVSMDTESKLRKRPGYQDMMQHVRAGEIDCIYIYRLSTISHSEAILYHFFMEAMEHDVKVKIASGSISDYINQFTIGHKIEKVAKEKHMRYPWAD